jgi:hypothetical protein
MQSPAWPARSSALHSAIGEIRAHGEKPLLLAASAWPVLSESNNVQAAPGGGETADVSWTQPRRVRCSPS